MELIPIAMISDNNYAPMAAVVITSICKNTTNNCHFYIINSNILQENKEKILKLKNTFKNLFIDFIDINANNFFKECKASYDYWPNDVLLKMTLPEIINNVDKLLYLDCDIVVRGDIYKLYKEDLEQYTISAVPQIKDDKRKKALNINETHKYFNSGVLVIDCEKWRKNNYFKKISELFIKYKESLKYPDQDILNKCFENNYKILDTKFNLTNEYIDYFNNLKNKKELNNAIKGNVIRHFEAGDKPWLYNAFKKDGFDEFWYYAKMTDFFNILATEFMIKNIREIPCSNEIKQIKIFNSIVLFSICKINPKKTVIKLFGFIPIFTIKIKK